MNIEALLKLEAVVDNLGKMIDDLDEKIISKYDELERQLYKMSLEMDKCMERIDALDNRGYFDRD